MDIWHLNIYSDFLLSKIEKCLEFTSIMDKEHELKNLFSGLYDVLMKFCVLITKLTSEINFNSEIKMVYGRAVSSLYIGIKHKLGFLESNFTSSYLSLTLSQSLCHLYTE
jgi:hypothetical protein